MCVVCIAFGQALLVKEGILDASTTEKVADEMEEISNTMQTQPCCQESKVIQDFILGADMLARELRKSKVVLIFSSLLSMPFWGKQLFEPGGGFLWPVHHA